MPITCNARADAMADAGGALLSSAAAAAWAAARIAVLRIVPIEFSFLVKI